MDISNPSNVNAKVRFREPYVSQGLNRKLNGVAPPGILRGGVLSTNLAALSATILANPKSGDSVYSYINSTGDQITFRQAGDITLNLAPVAGTTVYVALYINYTTIADTAVYWRTYSEAELFGGAPVAEHEEVIVLGQVVVPGAGVIPAANITPTHRIEGWKNISRCVREWRQVVVDGDFELSNPVAYTGTEEEWSGWDESTTETSFVGFTPSVTNAVQRSGYKSLWFPLLGVAPQVGYLHWAGRVSVYEGQLIDASVWVRGALLNPGPGAGGHIGLQIVFFDSAGNLVSSEYVEDLTLSGSFSWTELSKVFAAPSTSVFMDIFVIYDDNGNSSTGDIYFDDVRVWVEVGESHDPEPLDDERYSKVRSNSIEIPVPPISFPLPALATLVSSTLRLRQDSSVGGLLQLFLGARGVKSSNPFNFLLQHGAIEIERVITDLGSQLLGTAANANIARVTAGISSVGVHTLLAELPQVNPALSPIRIYASSASSVSGGASIIATINAEWSDALSTWSRDIAANSILLELSLTGGLSVYFHPSGSVSPWTGGQWFSGPPNGEELLTLQRVTKTVARLEDAILSIVRSTVVTNPAIGTAPSKNSIYGKNIPKAWVSFNIVGGIPPVITIYDAFNVNTVTVNAAVPQPQIEIAFHQNFANNKYAPIYSGSTTGFTDRKDTYMTTAKAVGLLTVSVVDKSNGNILNAGTTNNGGSVVVFGEQSS